MGVYTATLSRAGRLARLDRLQRITKVKTMLAAHPRSLSRRSAQKAMVSLKIPTRGSMRQERVSQAYNHPYSQWAIAAIIFGNFVSACVEKQIDPWSERYPRTWERLDFWWNCLFLIELLWNLYGHCYFTQWEGHFFSSGWNVFNAALVGVSLPSMLSFLAGTSELISGSGGAAARALRAFRYFRVLRLFRRVKSLNKIIIALANSVPGLVSATGLPPSPPAVAAATAGL